VLHQQDEPETAQLSPSCTARSDRQGYDNRIAADIAAGHDTRSALRIHNHQDNAEVVITNGQITGRVLDAQTGAVVGGFAGAQTLPRITFDIPAHQSGTIPLLIGTASSVGALGYAVPPGEWVFDAIVTLERGKYRTPPLPLTVTR